MSDFHPLQRIKEIQENIKSGNAIKTPLILTSLGASDQNIENILLHELTRSEISFNLHQLLQLFADHTRLAAELSMIKEILLSQMLAQPELLKSFLINPKIKGQEYLIQIAGELQLTDLTPALIKLAASSQDEAEIKLLLETLGKIGDSSAIKILNDYLYSENHDFIMTAVHALGQMGTPPAMNKLAERMGTDTTLDLLILAIFAEVRDTLSLEKLNGALRSSYVQIRTYAKLELVRIGAEVVPRLVGNFLHDDPDFQIHTLNVLGDIGDVSAIMPIRKLLGREPRNANVRFAAYEALSILPLRKGAYILAAGLTDKEDHVCIAAARAIEQNYSDILKTGIKNLIMQQGDEAQHIVKIIVSAQVDKIFLDLADEPRFREMAMIYLPHAHQDIRHHYHALLVQRGVDDFAELLVDYTEAAAKLKIVAVDDSRMTLNIYRATLHELGYEPVLFEFPASALQWLEKERPFMVLTDLNMPEMSGVDLTSRIRERYSLAELPVIMVTTQNEMQDDKAARAAGVNKIIRKPFNTASLKAELSEFR